MAAAVGVERQVCDHPPFGTFSRDCPPPGGLVHTCATSCLWWCRLLSSPDQERATTTQTRGPQFAEVADPVPWTPNFPAPPIPILFQFQRHCCCTFSSPPTRIDIHPFMSKNRFPFITHTRTHAPHRRSQTCVAFVRSFLPSTIRQPRPTSTPPSSLVRTCVLRRTYMHPRYPSLPPQPQLRRPASA